jgi:Uma2 family endonuclease
MTALPSQPQRLLTVADYLVLPEDAGVRHELQEGILVMSPRPLPDHQLCLRRICRSVEDQLPVGLEVLPEVDIDLQLVPPDRPATVRAPDLVVVPRVALERVRHERGLLRATEVVLAVEIISPGSRRLDTVLKHSEYADAGIPHYWIVDLGEPGDRITLTAHHLAGEFGYADAGPVVGVFTATEPFPVRIDLDELV